MKFFRVYDLANRSYVSHCFESKIAALTWARYYDTPDRARYEVEGPCYLRDIQWVEDNLAANNIQRKVDNEQSD